MHSLKTVFIALNPTLKLVEFKEGFQRQNPLHTAANEGGKTSGTKHPLHTATNEGGTSPVRITSCERDHTLFVDKDMYQHKAQPFQVPPLS